MVYLECKINKFEDLYMKGLLHECFDRYIVNKIINIIKFDHNNYCALCDKLLHEGYKKHAKSKKHITNMRDTSIKIYSINFKLFHYDSKYGNYIIFDKKNLKIIKNKKYDEIPKIKEFFYHRCDYVDDITKYSFNTDFKEFFVRTRYEFNNTRYMILSITIK